MAPGTKDKYASANGLRLHYRDWGGSGQPLVLLHGLASTCRIWDLVAPILAEDFSVVALDQRGHGLSDKPDHGYDFASVSRDLREFVREMGMEQPLVVGHSWGGSVALEFAVRYPELPMGLCWVDGGMIEISGRPGATLENAKQEMAPPSFEGVTTAQLLERARTRRWLGAMDERLEGTLLANFRVLDDGTIRARLSRENHMRIIEALWVHRPSELYARVRQPVLIMPARRAGDQSARGAAVSARGVGGEGRRAAVGQQARVARRQHPRRAVAASGAGGGRDHAALRRRLLRLAPRPPAPSSALPARPCHV